jgi:quinohemoprotein ethanol dehydrogenase
MLRKAICLCLAGLALSASRVSAEPVGAGSDWVLHGGDPDETDYSRLRQIDTGSVKDLGLAWFLDLPGEVSLEATPIEVAGTLYFTGTYGKVYAVNGASGKILWAYDPQVWKFNPGKMHLNFAVSRGVAFADGRIFVATFDGRLQALDSTTGKLIWSIETTPHDSVYFVTGAPRVFDGKVIIGNGGGDFGARGYVTAYEQTNGKQAWRFYVTPGSPAENKGDPAMERAAASWKGDYWKTGTGGSVWDNITFDAKYNRIYIATGNGGPTNADTRSPGGGDTLYTASVVALDADTGKYIWHYQYNPRDTWNYDCTQQMTLAELTIDGKPRDVLMQAPKNGFFYVIDRTDGKLISAEKLGKVTWADRIDIATGRPVETKDARSGVNVMWPNPVGAHSWEAMSYSPKTGLVYIPYMQNGVRFYKGPPQAWDFDDGGTSFSSYFATPEDGKGALLAWDPVQQKLRWKVQYDAILNGGTLSTEGNLVFQGTADGSLVAYDAASGKPLWRFNAGLGIMAPPISYELDGRQYVAVLVGYGGSSAAGSDVMDVGWKWGAPRRLLAFAIGGSTTLPPSPARDLQVHALDDPKQTFSEADVQAGRQLFLQCVVCHGRELDAAGGPAPDLRESAVPLDPTAFRSVVQGGSLMTDGMPRFDSLTASQVEQLRAYIRTTARAAITDPKSTRPPLSN